MYECNNAHLWINTIVFTAKSHRTHRGLLRVERIIWHDGYVSDKHMITYRGLHMYRGLHGLLILEQVILISVLQIGSLISAGQLAGMVRWGKVLFLHGR